MWQPKTEGKREVQQGGGCPPLASLAVQCPGQRRSRTAAGHDSSAMFAVLPCPLQRWSWSAGRAPARAPPCNAGQRHACVSHARSLPGTAALQACCTAWAAARPPRAPTWCANTRRQPRSRPCRKLRSCGKVLRALASLSRLPKPATVMRPCGRGARSGPRRGTWSKASQQLPATAAHRQLNGR